MPRPASPTNCPLSRTGPSGSSSRTWGSAHWPWKATTRRGSDSPSTSEAVRETRRHRCPAAPYPVPAPPAEFADAVLGSAGLDTYLLDLRDDAPAAVRAWLDAPARTRVIGPVYDPADNAAHRLSGGSLADWFDILLHSRVVTPVRFLEQEPSPAARQIGQGAVGGKGSVIMADGTRAVK
ncbi:erythromycin esterase family protein [Streptomyces sp. NPDC055082]|uniref:erythromycin esterase family protein n=1 Tax=Streptomyces sp. NPDC055082 TaxID=3365718 RepID=UPI0037D7082A